MNNFQPEKDTQHETDAGYKGGFNPTDTYKRKEIAESYDRERFSNFPGQIFDRLEKDALGRTLRQLSPGSLILDVPTGTGRLAETMLEMGHRVVGVDISPAMLDVASNKLHRFGDRYTPVVGDAYKLEFEEKSFDAVVSARVLMHFPLHYQVKFLNAVAPYSKGPVIFNQSLLTPFHRLRRSAKQLFNAQPPASFHVTPKDLEELLAKTNLREQRRFNVFPFVSEAVFFDCKKIA